MSKLRKPLSGAALATVLFFGGASMASAKDNSDSKVVQLTSAQETCMAGAKSAAKGQSGVMRKSTMKAAAQTCGVWKRFNKLSDEQKSCLASQGFTRPSGAPTQAQKRALKNLASSCGITLKTKG